MPLDFSQLESELTRDNDVNSSAAALIAALADEVAANKNDPVALQAMVDRLRSQSDALASAVAANTSGAPPPAARGNR